ncbi:hypothetical protein, partial [Pseudomonas viridiflava]|uniref:hypothetical protein n=1 Tax=Pseudomonas viridiflava TaxID=33069 RepID=UPI00197CBB93
VLSLASADTLNRPNITSAQARSQPAGIQRTPEIHEEKSVLRVRRLKEWRRIRQPSNGRQRRLSPDSI